MLVKLTNMDGTTCYVRRDAIQSMVRVGESPKSEFLPGYPERTRLMTSNDTLMVLETPDAIAEMCRE